MGEAVSGFPPLFFGMDLVSLGDEFPGRNCYGFLVETRHDRIATKCLVRRGTKIDGCNTKLLNRSPIAYVGTRIGTSGCFKRLVKKCLILRF